MPDIRYVCLSDMHLGEEDSLLTNLKTASTDTDPLHPSPVMESLVECLKFLVSKNEKKEKPRLVLNGDILELALTTTNQAAMVFERFIELIMPSGKELFEKIIYIPGNHDHHLWESARETQYVNHLNKIKFGDELDIPWHTTKMFTKDDSELVRAYFLTELIRRAPHLKDVVIYSAYPNWGICEGKGQKCVIFSHGHFIEPLYQLMSFLKNLIFPDRKMPEQIWEIEAENFAWIDFFWSTMGRSGTAGQDIELIYEKMQDREQLKGLLFTLAESLAKKYDLPGWGDKMEAKLLEIVFSMVLKKIGGTERTHTNRPLSEDAERGLWAYMNGPVRRQILCERAAKKEEKKECDESDMDNEKMPNNLTFVFGHTHKPFQEDMNFKGYPQWVNVYNTGGWVVETVEAESLHGGAMVLIDEDLNTTSVRMYNEKAIPDEYKVEVREARHPGESPSAFHQRIESLIKPDDEPFRTFSSAVARAVNVRAQNLRARINEKA